MLKELVQAADRFRCEGDLPPTFYKAKEPTWIVHIRNGSSQMEGPYSRGDIKALLVPDRQRAGKPTANNLEPYLLFDDARYALGKAEVGKEDVADLVHEGFKDLLKLAYKDTDLEELKTLIDFLDSPSVERIREQVEPRDLITFRVNGKTLSDDLSVQRFWAEYLEQKLTMEFTTACAVCAEDRRIMRKLPRDVVILGQKCSLTSFNQAAFTSFGRNQTTNAPLCCQCAGSAVDALDYLTRADRHHRTLYRSQRATQLQQQLAIFWLREKMTVKQEEEEVNLEDLLGAALRDTYSSEDHQPYVDLSQLRSLLKVPWTTDAHATGLDQSQFHLAILSANKGRLVLREWLQTSLETLRSNLSRFLQAATVVTHWGEVARPAPISSMLQAMESGNPNLSRQLLRTAYAASPPPVSLIAQAVKRFRVVIPQADARTAWQLHALASVMKLVITHGNQEEEDTMESLDKTRNTAPHLCGRLLALLERAQLQASGFNVNRSVVESYYGAASTAPASTFGGLLRLATTAHLPKVGGTINKEVEQVVSQLETAGGFPKTLTMEEQADFALGFYLQRAALRASSEKSNDTPDEQGGTP